MTTLHALARRSLRLLRVPRVFRPQPSWDPKSLATPDPGSERVIAEAIGWLGRAQDASTSNDGGVARHFSPSLGWSASYPETTGYIIPTMLACAARFDDETLVHRARRMLDWLVSIQFPEGGFQGGVMGQTPVVPVTFNTGQILMGLAAGVRELGPAYQESMHRAARWLCVTQDADGCWRKHPTPFAAPGEKVYETHVAWGLLEAARVEPNEPYAEKALANVRWALTHQRENGWFDSCCLEQPRRPLTHTLGYALRGVVEAYRFTGDATLLAAACKTANGLLSALGSDGFLPGRLDARWRAAVPWACLTGTVQIAHCWLLLYEQTGDPKYRVAALAANAFVRRTMDLDGPPEIRGGVAGSFPIDGEYGTFQYLNWACKFCIDSNLLELDLKN